MIQLSEIEKSFAAVNQPQQVIFQDLNIDFIPGKFYHIIGPNGTGKSTLLNIISGKIKSDKGNIVAFGKNITLMPFVERSKFIANIFQNPLTGVAPDLTLIENFRIASLRSRNKPISRGIDAGFINLVKEKLAPLEMGLENKLDDPIGNLSGGQIQAATIVMSMLDDCKIFLMDEPTAALDPKSSDRILHLAESITKSNDKIVIMVTHQMKEALQFGDQIIVLQNQQKLTSISKIEKQQLSTNDLYKLFEI